MLWTLSCSIFTAQQNILFEPWKGFVETLEIECWLQNKPKLILGGAAFEKEKKVVENGHFLCSKKIQEKWLFVENGFWRLFWRGLLHRPEKTIRWIEAQAVVSYCFKTILFGFDAWQVLLLLLLVLPSNCCWYSRHLNSLYNWFFYVWVLNCSIWSIAKLAQ